MPKRHTRKSRRRGLIRTVGSDVSKVGNKGKNIAKSGVSSIYNLLSSGFSMGTKDAKKGLSLITKRRRTRKSRKSRKGRKH